MTTTPSLPTRPTTRLTTRLTTRRPATSRPRTARLVTALAAAATVALAGCTSSGPAQAPTSAITSGAEHAPTTITVWSFHHLPNEVAAFKAAFEALKGKYPWLTVDFVPNKDDAAFAKAVAAGDPPDVFIAAGPDNVGRFCYDGTVSPLDGFLSAAKVDVAKTFPPATTVYTRYEGKTCALPLLTDVYALFYNKKLFAEAGITAPPKTLGELTADAKKLTRRKPDGTVTTFGFVPRSDYSTNSSIFAPTAFGGAYYGSDGKATFASDPRWAELLRWDKDLVDWYGQAQVQRFVGTYNAHTDDAQNPFVTGAAAMEFDGEWHVGELAENAPSLDYGVAPMPVADSAADVYGAGFSAGTVIYLPAKAKHQQEAFFAAQQLATDTTFLTTLADAVSNIPTTFDSLAAWKSASDPHWSVLVDIFKNPRSGYKQLTPAGSEDGVPFGQFVQQWESGKATDLTGGLARVATKTDTVNAQARQ